MTLVYPDHFWKTGGKALKIARGLLLLLSLFSHEPDTFQPSPVLLIFAVTPDRCSEFLTCLMEKAYLGGIKHNLKNPRSWVAVIRMDHRDTNVPVFPPQSVFHYTSHGGSGLLLYYPHLLQSRSQVPPSQVVRPPCPSTWGSATGSASTNEMPVATTHTESYHCVASLGLVSCCAAFWKLCFGHLLAPGGRGVGGQVTRHYFTEQWYTSFIDSSPSLLWAA